MTAAKAFVAGLIAGLSPIGNALQAHTFDAGTAVFAVIAALVAFGAVFFVPNRSSPGA